MFKISSKVILAFFLAIAASADGHSLKAESDVLENEFVVDDGIQRNLGGNKAANWGLDRIDERELDPLDGCYDPYKGLDGTGITVYVIDSGIRTRHQEFEGRASWGRILGNPRWKKDCNGHGTHVAGIIGGKTYGVAPKVNLVAVKILNCDNEFDDEGFDDIMEAFKWIKERAVPDKSVVNMSWGWSKNETINKEVNEMVTDHGIVMVASARNYRTDDATRRHEHSDEDGEYDADRQACRHSPASATEAITVGATDENDNMMDIRLGGGRRKSSSWGSCVDIWAPGDGIRSAFPTNSWNSGPRSGYSVTQSNTKTIEGFGTSMATPFVAGAAALLLQDGYKAIDVKQKLLDMATPGKLKGIGDNLKDNKGNDVSSPNLMLYIGDGVANTCSRRRTEEFLRGSK